MNPYIVFFLGMVVGCAIGIFIIALLKTSHDNYTADDYDYEYNNDDKKICNYLLDKGN